MTEIQDAVPAETEGAPASLPFSVGGERVGFRLAQFELRNWGTFHDRVWQLNLGGDNALLTGDIGSGKSTLVDAITSLLVPPQKISFNKAAGAEQRERDLRSYVLGHYKSERGDTGGSAARPVALRKHGSFSVLLARFENAALGQCVTLAQIFWFKEAHGQPARFYVVADHALTIAEHFTGFGNDIAGLRKRLRDMRQVELFDSFPPYGAAFRRRFGLDNEQALELFAQTVSMKSIGNLTEFVRAHMLEPFPVEARITALVQHFDDLHRAHQAIVTARRQIELLTPLILDCDAHTLLTAQVRTLADGRNALRGYFADLKCNLLDQRIEQLDTEADRLSAKVHAATRQRDGFRDRQQQLRQAIHANGGQRIEWIGEEIGRKKAEEHERQARSQRYAELVASVGLPMPADEDCFIANRRALAELRQPTEQSEATAQNARTEATVLFRGKNDQHTELAAELQSLQQRRSNIPRRMLDLRQALCDTLNIDEERLPFAGELLAVRPEARDWEGTAERILHNFGLSLLVPDELYGAVADWVDRTHLRDRLVYYRVRTQHATPSTGQHPQSLVRKLSIKPDSSFYGWLDAELARRFDFACCDTLEQFRREPKALTRAGQSKNTGERHEKDDRHALNDRTRYVLGWSNREKIEALRQNIAAVEHEMQQIGTQLQSAETEIRQVQKRLQSLQQLDMFGRFPELDWATPHAEIERLDAEREQLARDSDILQTLNRQLAETDDILRAAELSLKQVESEAAKNRARAELAGQLLAESGEQRAQVTPEQRNDLFPLLDRFRENLPAGPALTVEICDNRQHDMREAMQGQIDAEEKRCTRLRDKIISAMEAYRNAYPLATQEVDSSIEAAPAYRDMQLALTTDDLPRFEEKFKALLNENTIREIANFQSQLFRERHDIRERVASINESLHEIDYNDGRFIRLEAEQSDDVEVRDFQQDLRTCIEGTLTGSDDAAYAEAKFLQVQRLVERFRGREGSGELDRRWTRKVTDVRNWFVFAASERWREDDTEHEHYTDSGGKSGGQKEKLAYTVLAASLAYQFGLEWRSVRERSFRFVMIDEAFGRGSDESARYGLDLFRKLGLQLLVITPLQKIHVIEPFVAAVGYVHNPGGNNSLLRNLTIEQYREEQRQRGQ